MVSGLIEQEDIGPKQHCPSQGKFHLPTTGQATDRLCLTPISKADRGQRFNNFSLGSKDALVCENELQDGRVFLAAVNVVFNVERPDFIGRRETLNLATIKERWSTMTEIRRVPLTHS
jgi:hypothetical protein